MIKRETHSISPSAQAVSDPVAPATLVIGYGNTLRGDDGVGYQVAEAVLNWHLAGIHSLPCHQLTPELAADIAQVQRVVFVDAAIAPTTTPPEVTLETLHPDADLAFTTHTATPSALLALTKWLYGATPTAYQLTIPAIAFAMGEILSPMTAQGKALALERLRQLCTEAET